MRFPLIEETETVSGSTSITYLFGSVFLVPPRGMEEISTIAARERLAAAASWAKLKEYFMVARGSLVEGRKRLKIDCGKDRV